MKKEYLYILYILIILVFAKILALLLVIQLIDNNLVGDLVLPESIKTDSHLLKLLAYHWDSAKYVDIAWYGYNDGVDYKEVTFNYSFPPLYPFFIKLANIFIGNFLVSTVIVSNLFHFLTLVIFFYLIKLYTDDLKISFYTTIIFGLFPMLFVFSLMSYSEPTFLFFAVLSWYFFEKKKYLYSGIVLSLATLARYYGVMIVLIYAIILMYEKRTVFLNKIFLTGKKPNGKWFIFLPVIVFFMFSFYLSTFTGGGDIFLILNSQKAWGSDISSPMGQFNSMMTEVFVSNNIFENALRRYMFTIPFFLLSFYLLRIDKRLFIYSIVSMVFILSLDGPLSMSTSRYVLLAWPTFLVFSRIKDPIIVMTISVFFLIFSLWGIVVFNTGFYA